MTHPREQSSQNLTSLPAVTSEHVNELPRRDKRKIPTRSRAATFTNISRWNTSTHVKENPYVPDLLDAYPRDPFTKMPPKRDAIEVYRLLQSKFLHLKNDD